MRARDARIGVLSIFLLLVTGCASLTQFGAPKAKGPKAPPPGSSWVLAEKNTGSYGSGAGQFTMLSLGEKRWNGRRVIVYSDGATATYEDSKGRLLAIVRGDRPVATFEPYFATFDWPLYVGKQWLNRYRYVDHEREQAYGNLQQDARVEAYEKVKTPAGTFKAFKIVLANALLEEAVWWSPELGIFIKYKLERFRGHPLKAGTRERALVSYSLQR